MKSKSVAAGVENSGRDVSKSEANRPQLSNVPSIEEIQRRAYEIHIERGSTHGQDVDDWLKAERELAEKYRADCEAVLVVSQSFS